MNRKLSTAVLVGAILALGRSFPEAATVANFTVYEITSLCNAGEGCDWETWPYEDPEPHYRMAIFDYADSSTLSACANGCSGGSGVSHDYCNTPEDLCGYWNLGGGYTLSKTIPGGRGAYFYFGLFDEDVDSSDSIGDHWSYYRTTSDSTSLWTWNNDSSPYYPGNYLNTVCGWGTEYCNNGGNYWDNNYQLRHRLWFTDTTAPSIVYTPTHSDDGLTDSGWDNDTRLDFSWSAASDPDTGIQRYQLLLMDETDGSYDYYGEVVPSCCSITFCSSGCSFAHNPEHGHQYRYRIWAYNGIYPQITNQSYTWSPGSAYATIDLVNPSTSVTSPAANTWLNGTFSVLFSDTDSGPSYIDPDRCRVLVSSSGTTTVNWTSRTYNSSYTVTVGASSNCRDQGSGKCVVYGYSYDRARLYSGTASRSFSIDWSADNINTITARTYSSGPIINPEDWTQDRDPYFYFTIRTDTQYAPISRYYWAVDVDPAPCSGNQWVTGGQTGSVQLATNYLAEGTHTFRVRPSDQAGNCGNIEQRTVQVDYTPDNISLVRAFTQAPPGETEIYAGQYQRDTDPYLTWTAPSSTAPIYGYDHGTGSVPSTCTRDTTNTNTSLSGLAEGITTFWVRAIDWAYNCGAPSYFNIAVDTQQDTIPGLRVYAYEGGPEITAGQWQQDTNPYMTWTVPSSTSPIAGYSWGMGGSTNCTIQTDTNEADVPLVPDGVTTLWVRAIDQATNCGPPITFQIAVDHVGDSVPNLQAWTYYPGGSPITNGAWQQDNDPVMIWDPAVSTSPILGYSFGTGTVGVCSEYVNTLSTPLLSLPEGQTTFWVRAYDEAHNCGPASQFTIKVDRTGDPIPEIHAYTEDHGTEEIFAEVWQDDDDPWLTWVEPVTTLSGIAGYSFGTGSATDCIMDDTQNETSLENLPDGVTTFWVRAIDEAGNCGPATTIEIPVDRTGDSIPNLRAYTEPGGILIAEATWQQDNDPFMVWDLPASAAPMAGYSVGVDEEPAYEPSIIGTFYPFAEDALGTSGMHTITVRGVDVVGNWGPVEGFDIWVRTEGPTLTFEALRPNPIRANTALTIQVSTDFVLEGRPTVTVGEGREAVYLGFSEGIYSYQYDVVGTEVDTDVPAGAPVPVTVEATAAGGATGSTVGLVIFDFNPPPLIDGITIDPPVATTGDELTIEFAAGEPLRTAPVPTVLVDGTVEAEFESQDGSRYRYRYTANGGEGEGLVQVAATLMDVAGNQQTHVETFELDLTPPSVTFLSPDRRLVADLGDVIEIVWHTTDLHPDTATIYLSRDSGATFPTILADGVPDTGSYLWTVSGEQSNLARLRVMATDVVGLTGYDDGEYDFRIRDPRADHIIASVDDGVATVGAGEVVTLTVVDSLGDPVEGLFNIAVMASGSAMFADTSLTGATTGGHVISGTTDASGMATVEVTDLVAELVQVTPGAESMPAEVGHISAYVTFNPAGADHLVVHVTDGVSDVGATEKLTIVAVDAQGNPTDTQVVVRLDATGSATFASTTLQSALGLGTSRVVGGLNSDGTATVDVTDGVAEMVVISATSDSLPNLELDEPASVLFTQISDVDPGRVTIEAEPSRVYADGVAYSQITVTPRNSVGDVLGAGLYVDVLVDFGDRTEVVDEGDGTYTSRLTSEECREEPVSIGARVEDVVIEDGAQVVFTCDQVVSATLTADPETIVADGETCAEIVLTLYDEDARPLPSGQAVELHATYGILDTVQDPGDGHYTSTLCSTICADDPIVVTATVNAVSLSGLDPPVALEVPVECLPVDPATSLVEAVPITVPADGRSASTITVTPIRLDGMFMGSGLTVGIASDLGDLTPTYDEGDGTYSALLTSIDTGEARVTAQVTGAPLDDHALVTFVQPETPVILVDLTATLQSGEPAPGATVVIQVEVANQSGRDLDQIWIGFDSASASLNAADCTWLSETAQVFPDEASGGWRIELGELALTGEGPDHLVLSVRFDDEAEGESVLAMVAYREAARVSEEERLVFTMPQPPGEAAPEEACYCSRIDGLPRTLVWWLIWSGFYLVLRRRRAPSRNPSTRS